MGPRRDSRTATQRVIALLASLMALAMLTAPAAFAERASSGALAEQASRIDAGGGHTCKILERGSVRCWGLNSSGQLGYGNTDRIGDNEHPRDAGPVDLGTNRSAVAIGAGGVHTCAVLDDNSVRCWGSGGSGRLGYGNTNSVGDIQTPGSFGPVDLGPERSATDISAGDGHSCALLDDGTVRCWGVGDDGRLGYGNTNDIGDTETPGSVAPVDLGAGRSAVAVSAGDRHTCALLDDGTVRCWGLGTSGQLGYGNTALIGDDEAPGSVGPVDLGANRQAVAISAGGVHTCALLDNGSVRCWGLGANGRLGYGNTADIGDDEAPGSVGPVDFGGGHNAVAISAGAEHTCARLDDGTTRCWGRGAGGRLGRASTNDFDTPGGAVDVGSGRRTVAITAGGEHTCARLENGATRCWGAGTFGRLGYANTNDVGDNETPGTVGPVNVGADPRVALARSVIRVAAGDAHTCALLDDGNVRCWGHAGSGQLGYGNADDIGDTEIPGAFGPVDLGNNAATEITAGKERTCALLDNGTVRCWGSGNSAGQAVDLGEGRAAVAVSAGGAHFCAVLDNGRVRCWGNGGSGQLGYGNTEPIATPGSVAPVDLGFRRLAVDISAGDQHTCAIVDNGGAICWGSNDSRQLGYPARDETRHVGDDETPGAVGAVGFGAGIEATSISSGTTHTCARLDDGTVRCWGSDHDDNDGRLGYGHTADVIDPEAAGAISLGGTATEVGAGMDIVVEEGGHSCARLADGSVRCWGWNQNGQLGYANTENVGDDEPPSAAGPVDFGPARAASELTVGGQHNCVVLDQGDVSCWGFGEGGRLGYGNADDVGDDETPAEWAVFSGPVDVIDDPPTAVDDFPTLDEDAPATDVPVLVNDTDTDQGPKRILSATDPANGTAAITGGGSGLTYKPDPDYCNSPGGSPDTFTYTLNGGSSATVSVTVTCVDDPAPGPGPGPGTGTGTGSGTGAGTGTGTGTGTVTVTEDVTAPDTRFTKKPKVTTRTKKKRAKLKFEFTANEDGAKFECSFDGKKFRECTSPHKLKAKRGTHTFDVRAYDLAGNVDRTPATYAFEVLRKKKKKR